MQSKCSLVALRKISQFVKTYTPRFSKLFLSFCFVVSVVFTSCHKGFHTPSRAKSRAYKSASTGKDETVRKGYYSNPFKGGSRAALKKYKRKKNRRIFNGRKGKPRKNPKSKFNMKRTVKKSRLKSSGSNYKRGNKRGGSRKNNSLFKTRKK